MLCSLSAGSETIFDALPIALQPPHRRVAFFFARTGGRSHWLRAPIPLSSRSGASAGSPLLGALRSLFHQTLHEIHAPVPGFNKGTRNAHMIERIFDNLLVEKPTERFNWSIYSDDELFHDDRFGEHFSHTKSDDVFLRIEHQTLRKLPVSGDILFTIRIHVDPIEALAAREDRKEIASAFVDSLRELTNPQLEYKGLDTDRELLITKLEEVVHA